MRVLYLVRSVVEARVYVTSSAREQQEEEDSNTPWLLGSPVRMKVPAWGLAKTRGTSTTSRLATTARLDQADLRIHNGSVSYRGHVVKLAARRGGGEKY